jgi:hypothetical protein
VHVGREGACLVIGWVSGNKSYLRARARDTLDRSDHRLLTGLDGLDWIGLRCAPIGISTYEMWMLGYKVSLWRLLSGLGLGLGLVSQTK